MASKNNKPVLSATTVQRKEFNYNLGNITLNFTLRTDVKTELKAWLELMERAAIDVKAELDAIK